MSQALIKPEAGSQGGWHRPCSTASRASVFGHALGFSLQADLHPLQKGGSRGQDWDQQVWPIPGKLAALQHGWRAEQGRSPLGAALAMPRLCLGHTQLPTPLLSPLTGLCAARHGHLRMKRDPSCSVLGKETLSGRKLAVPGWGLGRKKRIFQAVSGRRLWAGF